MKLKCIVKQEIASFLTFTFHKVV